MLTKLKLGTKHLFSNTSVKFFSPRLKNTVQIQQIVNLKEENDITDSTQTIKASDYEIDLEKSDLINERYFLVQKKKDYHIASHFVESNSEKTQISSKFVGPVFNNEENTYFNKYYELLESKGRMTREDLIKIDLPKVVAAGKKLGKLDPSYEPNEEEINKLTASAKEDGGTGSIKIMGDKVVYIPGSETKGAAQASTFESVQSELDEAYSTIETLKNELNEINLLNAKLLYTNKIFKAKNLNESQKVKVLSSFDKAKNVGEVKMVFETLNEGIKVSKNTIKEHLGSASKTTNTPSVKKPIVESNEAFLRMQKLAGII